MGLSSLERVMLINQYKILEKLYPDEASHYQRLIKVLERGYELHYDRIYEDLWEEMSAAECKEVLEIIDLYRVLAATLDKYGDNPIVKKEDVRFPGFDSGSEAKQLFFTQYFLHDLVRFKALHSPDGQYDSREPMLPVYRKMLQVWYRFPNRFSLTLEQVLLVLKVDDGPANDPYGGNIIPCT
ncbi:MAG: hypothetical protein XD78_0899 [Desulfotomaculum sp. 46_296]|nr:MAG: hypothetical protein XD78_0899 [Desulfotomaculum sp. 46_296]HAU31004.1 hypothetical protein [Desulfotomaculum sp.]